MNTYQFGLFAEYIAIIIYKLKFYRIIHHRKKRFVGEVDIVAIRGSQLVFVEVKARKGAMIENIVSRKQRYRIRQSAELFLSHNNGYKDCSVRFDLVFISPYKWPKIIKNVW